MLAGLWGLLLPCLAQAADLWEIFLQAEAGDPQYRAVRAETRATFQAMPQARALLLPTVDFSLNSSANDQSIDSQFGFTGDVSFNSFDYALNLSQPIFRFGRLVGIKQANSEIRQAEAELEAALQDLMVRAADRYFDVLAALDNLEFARAERRSLSRQLEQARKRFEVGVSAITDVQEAQSGFDRAVADEILAENELDDAREALREVTGTYYQALSGLEDGVPLAAPEPADIDEWTQVALAQNLGIDAANHALAVARDEIKRQASGHLPTLDLVASHSFRDSGGQFGSETETTSVGIQLNVPIFEGGIVLSRTREARALHEQALEDLNRQRRIAQRQTRDAFRGIMSGISRIQALEQAVKSSRTALEATRAGFEVGTRTAVDVVDAERALSEAQRDLSRARYDYIVDTLRLKRAAGTLSPNDLRQVNAWLQ